jgi:hypothetical protein
MVSSPILTRFADISIEVDCRFWKAPTPASSDVASPNLCCRTGPTSISACWLRRISGAKGYGTYIVSHLKRDLLSKGLRPICGCAIGNTGLLRAVRNAGFTSDHRLLLFKP